MLDLGHLPPGTPALLLMMGGLALILPVGVAMILNPAKERPALPRPRSVVYEPREPGRGLVPPRELSRLDQAIERVHAQGFGDARILHADSARKILRVHACACEDGESTCDPTRVALERAMEAALGRRPNVKESACNRGRCEFVVTY